MDVIAGQNLSQGNVDVVMKHLQMQNENARAALAASTEMRGQDIRSQDNQMQIMANMQNEQDKNAVTTRGQDLVYSANQEDNLRKTQQNSIKNAMEMAKNQDDSARQWEQLDLNKRGTEVQEGNLKLEQGRELLKEQQRKIVAESFQKSGLQGMGDALASLGDTKAAVDVYAYLDGQKKDQLSAAKTISEMNINEQKMANEQYQIDKLKAGEDLVQGMALINSQYKEDGPEKQAAMKELILSVKDRPGMGGLDPDKPQTALFKAQTHFSDTKNASPDQIAAVFGKDSADYNNAVKDNNNGLTVTTDKDGNTTVQTGGGKGSSTVMNKAVEKQNEVTEAADSLQLVKNTFNPDYYGYAARGKAGLFEQADKTGYKMTSEDKQWYKDYTIHKQLVTQSFNAYRKLVTGAAAAEQELKRLEKSYLNGEMGPIEAASGLDALAMKYNQDYARAKSAFSNGGVTRPSEFVGGQSAQSNIAQGAAAALAARRKQGQQ